MDISAFGISGLPRVLFGDGTLQRVPELAAGFGRKALLVVEATAFPNSLHSGKLTAALQAQGISWEQIGIAEEPSPQLVDEAAARFCDADIGVVVGIGGGSALDAAKAIAGLLWVKRSVMDYLEGVGPEMRYQGPAVPLIAVPTTAGTGAEATKNAVLSMRGMDGFKKSFRDEMLVPRYAVVDPELLATCPRALIAANGMDALTQLLESYVSLKANPVTDALALSGLEAVRDSLLPWHDGVGDAAAHRRGMAYGALLSGLTLAQVGLGAVHGLASPLGAFFPVPHGVVCGTLLAACTAANIRALALRCADDTALAKYADTGRLLAKRADLDDGAARAALLETLRQWTQRLELPRLSQYGMTAADIPHVVANCRGSSMKTNPLVLTDDEIAQILRERL